MKKSIVTILSILLLIAVSAGVYLAVKTNVDKKAAASSQAEEDAKIYVTDFDGSRVVGFQYTWQGSAVDVQYHAEDDQWVLADEPDQAISASRMKGMQNKLGHMQADRCFENPGSLADYGLDKPEMVLTATLDDGQTVVLSFGDKNGVTGNIYLLKQGDDRIYTIASSLYTPFQRTREELYDN